MLTVKRSMPVTITANDTTGKMYKSAQPSPVQRTMQSVYAPVVSP